MELHSRHNRDVGEIGVLTTRLIASTAPAPSPASGTVTVLPGEFLAQLLAFSSKITIIPTFRAESYCRFDDINCFNTYRRTCERDLHCYPKLFFFALGAPSKERASNNDSRCD